MGKRVPNGFGHMGYNGSGAWCDPDRELSIAFVTSYSMDSMGGDPRFWWLSQRTLQLADKVIKWSSRLVMSLENIPHRPIFIDCEASSLSARSFPIEVAWGSELGKIESYLINPSDIKEWVDWSEDSQRIHGISLKQLFEDGVDPHWVCQRMNESLAGQVLYSDVPRYDLRWIQALFTACGQSMTFVVGDAIWLMIRLMSQDVLAAPDVFDEPLFDILETTKKS